MAFVLCLGNFSKAQDFEFENLGIEEGLPSNKVFMTLEDLDGYIWIATENGVSRYDGRSLKTYQLQNIEDIRKRSFVTLFMRMDLSGKIWLISNNGLLFYFDKGQDQFQFYEQVLPVGLDNIYVTEFYIDHLGQMLVGSFEGVTLYDAKSHKASTLHGVQSVVSSIVQTKDHKYIIGSREGVMVYDQKLVLEYNLKAKESRGYWFSEQQKVESLYYKDDEKILWIGTEGEGLFFYDLEHNELSPTDKLMDIDVSIRSIVEYTQGKLLIGTDGGGIYFFDSFDKQLLSKFSYEDDQQFTLSSNAVYDILASSQGVIFVSTYRGGVNIHNPKRSNFSSIKHIRGNEKSLKNDVVFSIIEPSPGVLSFGTDKGISIWNKQTDDWKHLSLDQNGQLKKSAVVLSQTIDNDHKLWVASYVYSLSQFEWTPQGFKLCPNLIRVGDDLKVKRVFFHPHGELLVGTISTNLYAYSADGSITSYAIREPSDFDIYSNDEVIITTRNGIAVIDLNHKKLDWVSHRDQTQEISNMVIVSVLIDMERNIWIGTLEHGVLKIDKQGNIIDVFDISTGLASNAIFDMLHDDDNNLWIATSHGVSKISEREIANFYVSDGLISTDFNRNAGTKDSNGIIYFGTNRGVISFNPNDVKMSKIEKRIVLTEFYLNHKRILVDQGSILKRPLNEVNNLVLNYDQNSFSIGYASIDFVHSEQGKYAWQLDGFDENWVFGDAQDRATYTNLDPGIYNFRLKMTDAMGKSIGEERQISIQIRKPYWKTPLAYLVYFVFILSVVALLLYSNRLRLESKNAEERLHFLIEMAHEIKTPLTLIRAPLTDLLSNNQMDGSMKESLQVALNSAEKLHKQMMQFLDFRRINVRRNNLQVSSLDLVEFINSKIYAFKVLADKKRIALKFNTSKAPLLVNTDESILDKIVSNLISNAIKYTREDGEVVLEASINSKNWTLSVADNGIGISKEDQKRIFTLFFRTQNAKSSGSSGSGVGLVLASDLAHTLGGSVRLVKSDFRGSKFQITLPLLEQSEQLLPSESTETIPVEQELETETEDSGKLTILMVEDDEDLRNYQKSKFDKEYRVLTASNGEDALKMVANDLPDMIISDVVMPKMNGRQLCMNIKSNFATSHIPFILLTGQESKDHIQQGLESGADDYIVKPFDLEMLSSKIKNLLKTRAAIKDRFVTNEEENFQEISNELDQKFLDEITSMVEQNLSDPDLSVNHICQFLGMSRTSLYHKLKSLVDLSPAEFIRTLRLKRARKLLLNPMNNISEVAYSSGFSDAKYFSTLFKKYYNQSPSAFVAERRQASKN